MEVILPLKLLNGQKFLDCASKLDYDEFSAVSLSRPNHAIAYCLTFVYRKCSCSALKAAMWMCLS
ncbi:GL20452 [Drosophila persimilis]|uniref:GL20452 n=1 Tax=Drosophila persimilis TaxID=7234 RepID=B4HDP7_DROPE|nr:GL20452 [Drosophila persimilis]